MSLLADARFLPSTQGEDVETRVKPISGHDLKANKWVIEKKTGFPGVVSDLKTSKTGKHGHMKLSYYVKMPFSGKKVLNTCPIIEPLLEPVMERCEFDVSTYIDGEVSVLDENGNERFISLGDDSEVGVRLQEILDAGKSAQLTVLVGPVKTAKGPIELVEMPESVKVGSGD